MLAVSMQCWRMVRALRSRGRRWLVVSSDKMSPCAPRSRTSSVTDRRLIVTCQPRLTTRKIFASTSVILLSIVKMNVWKILIGLNVLKFFNPQWWEVEKWSWIRIRERIISKVNQFFRLVNPSLQQASMKSDDYFCSNLAHRQTDRQTDGQTDRHTDKPTWSHNFRFGAGKHVASGTTDLAARPVAPAGTR